MKPLKPKFVVGSLMGVALLLAGLTCPGSEAQARGGGGFIRRRFHGGRRPERG